MEKTILITGASSGIGHATALEAARQGHRLVLAARRQDVLRSLVAEIGDDRALGIATDVTDYEQVSRVVEAGLKKFGQLDAVFANAGMGLNTAGTEAGDPDEWRRMVDVNILGVLHTARATLPHLRKTTGHLLVTGSAAGRNTIQGSVYGASKWFVHGFAQNLSEEMKEWQGRCTVIAPGMVNTPFFDEAKPDKLDPQDVADAVLHAINANPRNSVREIYLMPAR